LRRKGVTLQLVWEEYRAAHPDGYGRSWFCELYRAWEGRLSPTMRQAHVPARSCSSITPARPSKTPVIFFNMANTAGVPLFFV
jgi:hypothetical protein